MRLDVASTFLSASITGTDNLVKEYLFYAENVRNMADTTLKSRRIYLKQFTQFLNLVGIELTDIKNHQLDFYFVQMSKRQSVRGRQITTGTVNTSKRAIKSFLKWCIDYRGIELDVNIHEIRENRREDHHPKILTHEEILTVIRSIRVIQDRLMISVMYEAGLRISELADLRIEHIRGRTVDIVGKGSKHRITYISQDLAAALHKWMEVNGWESGHVFRPLMHGGVRYVHNDTIRQRIKYHFKKEIGKDMHPHQLRHAFALRLLKSGCDLRSIQKMLGHSKIETTMAYLNIDNEHLEREHARSFKESVLMPGPKLGA